MTEKRSGHGTCIVGDYMYAACGDDGTNYLKSIERINIKAIINGTSDNIFWEVLDFRRNIPLEPSYQVLMTPLSGTSILIAGGACFYDQEIGDELKGKGVVLNLQSMQMREAFDDPGFQFLSNGNQVVPVFHGKKWPVAALVEDLDKELRIFTYSTG